MRRTSSWWPATLLACAAMVWGAPPASAGEFSAHVPDAQSVLEEALLRFDAGALERKRAVESAAHEHAGERCLTAFLLRVRHFSASWTDAERERVRGLDRILEHAVAPPAAGRRTAKAATMLPDYSELTETLDGASCIVHYTLTGPDASPNLAYVQSIRKEIDAAAKRLVTKAKFNKPVHEGAEDGPDKLHVYVARIASDPQLGQVLGAVTFVQDAPGDASGKKQTVYMLLSNDMASQVLPGSSLARTIRSTCWHEYMHCIQAAHNASLHRWCLEGQAMWAEAKFSKVKDGLKAFFSGSSVFTDPELPIWHETARMYTTATFFFYLDKTFGREGGMKRFLELAEMQDDPLQIFQTMAQERGQTFAELYPAYLAALHGKSLSGLKRSDIPNMKLADLVSDYGFKASGSVMRTGVQVYELEPQSDIPTTLLFARVAGTGEGAPVGVLRHRIKSLNTGKRAFKKGKDKSKRFRLPLSSWGTVEKFGKKAAAALLVTETNFVGQDTDPVTFDVEVFSPYIKVKDVEPQSPIGPFDVSNITVDYDLLGTPQGMSDFQVIVYFKPKPPSKNGDAMERFLFRNWSVGKNQQATFEFDPFGLPPASGTYKLNCVARTPGDAYGGEHTRSKFKAKVKVQ